MQDGMEMMNRETGQWEVVPSSEVRQAYLSGQYGLEKGKKYGVTKGSGLAGELDQEDLYQAFTEGYDLETPEQTMVRKDREKYGDRGAEAFLYGAAGGLTFHLSDLAIPKVAQMFGADPEAFKERMRKIEEYNAGAYGTGEVGSVLATLALPGVPLLRGAGVATRGVSKVGLAAEKAVAKALAKTGASQVATKSFAKAIARNALPKMAGSGIEGAIYGTGQLVGEAALGDSELNGELLLSHVGLGTLLGAGVGGVLAIPGGVFSATGARASETYASLESSAKKLSEKARATKSKADIAAAKKLWSKVTKMRETIEERTKKMGMEKRLRLQEQIDGPDPQSEYSFVDKLKAFAFHMDDPYFVQKIEQNPDKFFNAAPFQDVTGSIEKGFNEGAKTIFEGLEKRMDDLYEQSSNKFSDAWNFQLQTNDMRKAVKRLINRLGKRGAGPQVESLKKSYERMLDMFPEGQKYTLKQAYDTLKQFNKEVQPLFRERAAREGKNLISVEAANDFRKFLRGKISKTLRKRSGRQLADQFESIMADYSDFLQRRSFLQDKLNLSVDSSGKVVFGGQAKERFKKQWLRKMGFESGGDTMDARFVEELKKYGEMVGMDFNDQLTTSLLKEELFPQLQEQIKRGIGQNFATSFFARIFGHPLRAAQTQLEAMKGIYGALREEMGYKLLEPGNNAVKQFVEALGGAERVLKGQKDRITSGVNGYFSKFKSRGKPQASVSAPKKRLLIPAITMTAIDGDKASGKNRTEQLEKHRKAIEQYRTNPQMLLAELSNNFQYVDAVMPETGAAMKMKFSEGLSFIASKLPKVPSDPLMGVQKDYQFSDEQISKFYRYLEAWLDPMSVLDNMQAGTATREHFETLEKVYPRIRAEILGEVQNYLIENDKEVPYQARIHLSQLTGLPLDRTLQPRNTMFFQGMYQRSAEAEGQIDVPKVGKSKMSSRSQTEMQRIEGG